MVEEEKIKELEENYDVSREMIEVLVSKLMSYPIVRNEDDSLFLECLEIAVSIKSSQSSNGGGTNDNEIVERSLYRVYRDDAVPYLSEGFKTKNKIGGGHKF